MVALGAGRRAGLSQKAVQGPSPAHLQLGFPLRAAGHIALNLGLVHTVHGEPHQRATHHKSPEGIAAPRVRVKAGEGGRQAGNLVGCLVTLLRSPVAVLGPKPTFVESFEVKVGVSVLSFAPSDTWARGWGAQKLLFHHCSAGRLRDRCGASLA